MSSPLSSYLKAHRKKSGLTQAELATLLGSASKANISQYEHCKCLPQLKTAIALELLFGTDITDLFPNVAQSTIADLLPRLEKLQQEIKVGDGRRSQMKAQSLADMRARITGLPCVTGMSEHNPYDIKNIRVLAFVPTAHGTGFALLESPPLFMLDHGVVSPRTVHREHIKDLNTLITENRPDVVIVEDVKAKCSMRGKTARTTVEKIIDLASGYGIAVQPIAKKDVFLHFEISQKESKSVIAAKVAEFLPELVTLVPEKRRLWQADGYLMPIFEALALILTALKAD